MDTNFYDAADEDVVLDLINQQHTADVQEVKYGKNITEYSRRRLKMTHHEQIKNMSVEEMTEFIRDTNCSHCSGNCLSGTAYKGGCAEGIKRWLQSEANNDKTL